MINDRLREFLDAAIESHPIEAEIVRRTVKALQDNGTPVVTVWDLEEETAVNTTQDVLDQVFNLDEAWLVTADRSWVRLTMGEGYDLICDYTLDLEEALSGVNEWIEARW